MSHDTDFKWINEHYTELQEKYPDMYVAVKDGNVIYADREYGNARNVASKVCSGFVIEYILSGEPVVLTPYVQHSANNVRV